MFGIAIAHIVLVLEEGEIAVIVVFIAVMSALPLDWISNPVRSVLPEPMAAVLMVTPFAMMAMSKLPEVLPVLLKPTTALSTVEPVGMSTLTPGRSARLMGAPPEETPEVSTLMPLI